METQFRIPNCTASRDTIPRFSWVTVYTPTRRDGDYFRQAAPVNALDSILIRARTASASLRVTLYV